MNAAVAAASPPERVIRAASPTAIAVRARELWHLYGEPSGRDEQIWLQAERELRGLDLSRVRFGGGMPRGPGVGQTTASLRTH